MTSWTFNADVVSPQFPCGAAWLANALLELEVPLRDLWGFDTSAEWQLESDGRHRYVAEHLPWKQTLAGLRIGRTYAFDPSVRPRFSHLFPWQFEPTGKLVYMVRDPRDALYSEWRRHQQNEGLALDVDFEQFLKMPFFGSPVSIVDTLWLHLHCWLAMRKRLGEAMLVIRFEDWKRDPVAALSTITRWLGVRADGPSIRHAAAASDVQHLLAVERQVAMASPQARRFNRLGLPQEWHQTWTPSSFDALGEHWRPLFDGYGYAPPAVAGSARLDLDLAAFFSHRGLVQPAQVREWMTHCQLDGHGLASQLEPCVS